MSIQSEITRIETAKTSLKAAIEFQGVTVPEDASISYYPGYVYNLNRVKNGNVSTNSQTADYEIDTGYDNLNYFMIAKRSGTVNGLECAVYDGSSIGGVARTSNGSTSVFTSDIIEINKGVVTIKANVGSSSGCGVNGTYRWIAREGT